ncbi:MAG: hypothetical protein IPK82_39130 [Polyangiaceae bacterium]|nr:hypothetical protein [Polyangiaceae bacterium]
MRLARLFGPITLGAFTLVLPSISRAATFTPQGVLQFNPTAVAIFDFEDPAPEGSPNLRPTSVPFTAVMS